MEAYSAIHKFDIICLYETFLNSSLQNDDDSLVLHGYKLVRADNPSDFKRGGVCIYFKESLLIKVLHITKLHECLVCELFLNRRRSYIVSLYRSRSQSSDEYDHFIKTFEQPVLHLYYCYYDDDDDYYFYYYYYYYYFYYPFLLLMNFF